MNSLSFCERPRVLTIAGSDSSGGAGIQADLKTFAAFGVYGMSAITCVTAQNPHEVRGVLELPTDLVTAQLETVLEPWGPDRSAGAGAVKLGMLGSPGLIDGVGEVLTSHAPQMGPVVVDPVLVSSSGRRLLPRESEQRLVEVLFPLATVVTPNRPEFEALIGRPVRDEELAKLLPEVARRWGCAVLLKGGHGTGRSVTDRLAEGDGVTPFVHERVQAPSNHGTGCTLAAAIAARMAWGDSLAEAVDRGTNYVVRALASATEGAHADRRGGGESATGDLATGGPIDHFAGRRASEEV